MKTSEILSKAADIIDERGWYQGHYMPWGADRASCPVCALGAINVAAGFPPDGSPDESSDVAGPAGGAAAELVLWLGGNFEIDHWNDAPGQSAAVVVRELRACAADLAEAGQ